jgi:penicillin-binding protein 1B
VSVGTDITQFKLVERLRSLGYQRSDSTPGSPGEYLLTPGRVSIFLRGFSSSVAREASGLTTLSLDGSKVVGITRDGKELSAVLLEPEPLSLLGSSATRMSLPKPLSVFPKHLVNAVIAIEDERFYSHFGIDPIGIARAAAVNFKSGRFAQGGSTLTQQLAKNLLLSSERSLSRKALEAIAAILMETAFSKDQLLETYFNEVFLGQEGNVAIHGFGEAARSFFNKDVQDLSLEEAATLAGIIKAPTKYSPRRYPKNSAARRALVLNKMRELGFITPREEERAIAAELKVNPPFHTKRVAPYFVDYVRKIVDSSLTLPAESSASLKIFTSIDKEYQQCAEESVAAGLAELETRFPRLKKRGKSPVQAALVSVVPSTGDILAWVGGRDYQRNQFDRVSLAKRQPGSAFKPFVYLTALDGSLNSYRVARTTSILDDKPLTIEQVGSPPWSPSNYDKNFRGEVTLRQALTLSLNIPTVNLAQKVGIESVKRTAELFGFGENIPAVPSIALGAGEVTPLELARAYAALANGGELPRFNPVFDVTLADTPVLRLSREREHFRVASEAATFVLTTILQDAVDRGTARSIRALGFKGAAAGKTGTTNDARDAWFSGYTPRLLTVVWVGFDDNSELGLTGGQAAVPIWTKFMNCVNEPDLEFLPPPGVVKLLIDRQTGLLASDRCPEEDRMVEWFVEGTEPVTYCNRMTADGQWTADQVEEASGEEISPDFD